ncbi:MAG: hypothetical protein L0216_20645 [Planctomycetales bacterium]|nr:hypothetical protein [Planctomycetales bacterium]
MSARVPIPAIRYRGRVRDPERCAFFEERIVQVVLELDGLPRVVREPAGDRPGGFVRGMEVDLAPGVECVPLLVAPSGGIHASREAAARAGGSQPVWIRVRTGHGPPEAHAALAEILRWLSEEGGADLEIEDPSSDPRPGEERAAGAARERVRRLLRRPPEGPPLPIPGGEDPGIGVVREGTEAAWDAWFLARRCKEEGLHRAVGERRGPGDDPSKAMDDALWAEGIRGFGEADEGDGDEEMDEPGYEDEDEDGHERVWEPDEPLEDEPLLDPILQDLREVVGDVLELARGAPREAEGFAGPLARGALEFMGGGSQMVWIGDDDGTAGMRLLQAKRGLRGAGFALGSLRALEAEGLLPAAACRNLARAIEPIERDLRARAEALRGRLEG